MLKYTVKKYCSEGSKMNQVIMATMMVLPVFSYGTAIGWLSPMAPRLMSPLTPASAPVHQDVISWMASVAYLVGTPAVFLFGYIVDNCGRKKALLFVSLSMAACWSLKLYSSEPWALITARALLGLGVSGSYVVTPLYMKEISQDSIRGTLGSLVILSQNLGNLLVYILGEYLSYHAILWICLAVPLVHMLVFMNMPESPSYLLKCGKVEEARDALGWLRCRQPSDAAVDDELQRLLDEMEQFKLGPFVENLKTIVTDKATFRAFRITLIITLARELCGCLAVLHFASSIFETASGGGTFLLSANQQSVGREVVDWNQAGQHQYQFLAFVCVPLAMVLGVVQLLGSMTASSLVERTGRKPLLASTCLLAGVCMVALGLGLCWSWAWLPVLSLCLCIFCDAAGLQPVPFVVMSEIFSFQLRGTVTTLVIAFACALVSVELRVFQPLAAALGMHVVFWCFAGVCLASTLYIVLYLPETKMRSLQDIYEELGGKKGKDCEANVTRL